VLTLYPDECAQKLLAFVRQQDREATGGAAPG
jgi:hypothetical protein